MAGDHMQVLSAQIYNEQNIVLTHSFSNANAGDIPSAKPITRGACQSRQTVLTLF